MKRVPKIFHFVFGLRPQEEPFHLSYYLCLASCIAVNKPDAVYFHYKNLPYGEWWDRIAPSLVLKPVEENSFINSFDYKNKNVEQFRYAHLADIVRLEALLQYGGIYADIDSLFVNPVPEWFYDKSCIMGKEKVDWNEKAAQLAGGSLCNAWILAEKDSIFIKLWLEHIYKEFDGSWSAHSTFLPYKLSQQNPTQIHVEPERSFFHFDWSSKGIQNIFVNKVTDLEGVYSIHLWNHLWWKPTRTDFTYFHHLRFTPNYVAHAETTYSYIARHFLPADVPTDPKEYKRARSRERLENIRLFFKKYI